MIVGIMGKKGVGKDTAADFLSRDLGFVKISFADPMKRFCAEIFGWSTERVWGTLEEKELPDPTWNGLTPRRALQLLGTEWGRACHPEVWTRYGLAVATQVAQGGVTYWPDRGLAIERDCPAPNGVVFADCRFRNEYVAIKSRGGKMIRIQRPGYTGDGHASETEQDGILDAHFDYVIQNVGSLHDLRLEVCKAIWRLR